MSRFSIKIKMANPVKRVCLQDYKIRFEEQGEL